LLGGALSECSLDAYYFLENHQFRAFLYLQIAVLTKIFWEDNSDPLYPLSFKEPQVSSCLLSETPTTL
jgi:hypothetical protein